MNESSSSDPPNPSMEMDRAEQIKVNKFKKIFNFNDQINLKNLRKNIAALVRATNELPSLGDGFELYGLELNIFGLIFYYFSNIP